MREQKKEKFITLYLDTKNQVLKEEVVSIGSLNAS
ncbi:MAG: repair protein RadC, partial [Euryarchaeota archaeon]|nr:repair protein RadC [Euryarchaeota archaeon]